MTDCIFCAGRRHGVNITRSWMSQINVLDYPRKLHKKRRNQTEAYHRRIQKKWDKRELRNSPELKVGHFHTELLDQLQDLVKTTPFKVSSPSSGRLSSCPVPDEALTWMLPGQSESRLQRPRDYPRSPIKINILIDREGVDAALQAKIALKLDKSFARYLEPDSTENSDVPKD